MPKGVVALRNFKTVSKDYQWNLPLCRRYQKPMPGSLWDMQLCKTDVRLVRFSLSNYIISQDCSKIFNIFKAFLWQPPVAQGFHSPTQWDTEVPRTLTSQVDAVGDSLAFLVIFHVSSLQRSTAADHHYVRIMSSVYDGKSSILRMILRVAPF